MKLRHTLPALDQIRDAIKLGIPLCMDLRGERMGDKAAVVAVASWLHQQTQKPIALLETPQGHTDFMLSEYHLPAGVEAIWRDPYEPIEDMLDVHTAGNHDSLWILNPYLATIGIRSELALKEPKPRLDDIIVGALLDVQYNNRREMDRLHLRKMIDHLKRIGHHVVLLAVKQDDLFPEAVSVSIDVAVERIARARAFVGGDSGFTHVAAAFGTPIVALYPDWWMHGVPRMADAILTAEWWGLPTYYTPKSFLPNADPAKFRLVEIGSDHRWSIEHVMRGLATLYLAG